MELPRVIPCLLLRRGALVKTQRFKNPEYVGDPINTVRIYNEQGADELVFLDIVSTPNGVPPQFELIEEISRECYMPFAYGGGLHRFEDIRKVFGNGAEKVVLNTAAWKEADLVRRVAEHFGSQSVVVSIDAKKGIMGKTSVVVGCGREKIGPSPEEWAQEAVDRGAGELMITSVDREGTFAGYDRELVHRVAAAVPVPVIAHGGASSVEEMREVIQEEGAAAAAAGSLFVYRSKQRAVLINYPGRDELDALFGIRNPLSSSIPKAG